MVSSSRRTRYLCIEVKALHQLRKTLAAHSKRRSRLAAMPRRSSERRANESLLELESRVLQRFVRRHVRSSRNRRWQRRCADDTALRNRDDERGEHVLQLSNVARPIIPRERANGALCQDRFAADAVRRLPPESRREQRNVFHALAKRRHVDANHVEAVQQVLPKPSRVHQAHAAGDSSQRQGARRTAS